ncbi:MAG: SPOR domain-containing protein [Gemmatimonadales bacterium]
MLRRHPMRMLAGALLSAAAATTVLAQGAAGDSLVARVRRLAQNGNAVAARGLADSALRAAKAGSPGYAEALFARASVAPAPDSARKDYVQIVVDYSMSPREEEALLRLAQAELARGDRAAARQYLERLALEHPEGPTRAQGAYLLGGAQMDAGEVLPGCATLAEAKRHVAPGDVELANQINYRALPCAAAQHAADSARADSVEKVMRADSIAHADSIAKVKATARKRAKPAAPKAATERTRPPANAPASAPAKHGGWSAQVAAYDTRAEADRLAKKLKDRGYDTRVSADRPFRVRVGWFTHRDEAEALVAKLKAAKIDAIVVEAEKP